MLFILFFQGTATPPTTFERVGTLIVTAVDRVIIATEVA